MQRVVVLGLVDHADRVAASGQADALADLGVARAAVAADEQGGLVEVREHDGTADRELRLEAVADGEPVAAGVAHDDADGGAGVAAVGRGAGGGAGEKKGGEGDGGDCGGESSHDVSFEGGLGDAASLPVRRPPAIRRAYGFASPETRRPVSLSTDGGTVRTLRRRLPLVRTSTFDGW